MEGVSGVFRQVAGFVLRLKFRFPDKQHGPAVILVDYLKIRC
ncbi:MAG: hypothetical protein RLZZ458_3416 [Planctomycetota bacterium]